MKQYAFILGREHLLSLAELIQVFNAEKIDHKIVFSNKEFAVIEAENSVAHLFPRLGGIKKFAAVKLFSSNEVESEIKNLLIHYKNGEKKLNFGISIYNDKLEVVENVKKLGLSLKNQLEATAFSEILLLNFNVCLAHPLVIHLETLIGDIFVSA